MQDSSKTSVQLTYSNEELWSTWRSSIARKRHINFLLADGCSPKGARTQSDFDFDAHARKLGKRQTTPEDEIDMFEHDSNELQLWTLWSTSNARVRHITSLLTMGFSLEEAIGQADHDFKAHSLGFDDRGSTPEDEIKAFERYSSEEKLNSTWQSSNARKRHIKSLLANGFSPEGAIRQADVDFNNHTRELARREITPEAKVEDFEQYFDSVFEYSCWDQKEPDISPELRQCGEKSESADHLEAMNPDKLWRHLCERAGLTPQQVIGQCDKTIFSKDEPRAVETLEFALRERFKATGVSDVVIEAGMKGFEVCVGLM